MHHLIFPIDLLCPSKILEKLQCLHNAACFTLQERLMNKRGYLIFIQVWMAFNVIPPNISIARIFYAKTMLASMTISSTISPFVIDDNNSCSPCEHAPILYSSLPLWHQWSIYMCLKSLITTDCSPFQYAQS